MDRLKYVAVDNKIVLVIVSSSTHARLMTTHIHKLFAVKGCTGHEVLVTKCLFFKKLVFDFFAIFFV